MPWATNKHARLYWEEEGAGDPLLLIMGLSFSLVMWGDLRSFLARYFRIVCFDNRCVGKSSAPLLPFSVAAMARDAASVMDAAGIETANILGISMGGMIAQELALRYPRRVNRLILGCTDAGGRWAVRAEARVLRALLSPFMTRESKLAAMKPFLYHPGTPAERIARDLRMIRDNAPILRGYLQQLAAISFWSSWRRLPQIDVPTLVIHGDSDRLIPPENARILADRIRGAKLTILADAGHVFPTDQPELTRMELLNFLCPVADERRTGGSLC
jgi:pimeloyl-ACP methyl ester carboxylesterase